MEELIKERAKEITRNLGIIWLRYNGSMEKLLQELAPILAKQELEIKVIKDWIDDFGSVEALKKQTQRFADRLDDLQADISANRNEDVAVSEMFRSLESKVDTLSKEVTTLKESIASRQDPRCYNSQPKPEPQPEQTKPSTLPGDTK